MAPPRAQATLRVIRARALGMCFGVRDALRDVLALRDAGSVTVWGELVHNPLVITQLGERGFVQRGEQSRIAFPDTARVLITAHGVSDRERARLRAHGHELIDTTCPLVRHAHDVALRLSAEGRHVVVLGKRGHVEVQGLVGDLPRADVVWERHEVAHYPYPRLGVLAQTTTPPDRAAELIDEIRLLNPTADLRVVDTICAPTRDRQRALDELAGEVRVAVVVGGSGSNNTRELVARLARLGVAAHRVATAAELEPGWFAGHAVVGLAAGTSALPDTVDAVERRLRDLPVSPPR
ncbi:MAG: 4-hydroxy-3-methylbut-2-enyl diphosphate reductase [Planctomycetes bacterium]|nr:4-hydroxy-3-methylbut-2-enyl diphosphate reductase [Planctomycetota bacterium]